MSDAKKIDYADLTYLTALEERLKSGEMATDFKFGTEESKENILELLQKVMDVADLADEAATKMIFKNSYLAALAGINTQNDRDPADDE